MKKKSLFLLTRHCLEFKKHLTLELSHYHKSGSTFISIKPVAASSDCSRLGDALPLCLPIPPTGPAQAVQECAPKSLAIDFAVKTFNCLLGLPLGVIAK